jgi:hypothetical protein
MRSLDLAAWPKGAYEGAIELCRLIYKPPDDVAQYPRVTYRDTIVKNDSCSGEGPNGE